ncbi:MAG: DUF4235 domain-containing protein [Propionicimonas sp.]|uniref:DUF4235 domain-containing protein n=1 Tax=Propionicimonas sp. TaxID=1955623 RepID=UPI002B2097A8|nr:DUF4235 domain-containing protein [Propionicimonas sp.]MEA4943658.1 DUF4235 domain-containing protein [Propionicimonas sp.]MEA5055445.1 DUF4235 domain-containing protein [Propionicimonas sp.]MEA5117511.1 DUF4235 domain-containing protein [Propionicimonas sp.]
MAQSNPLMQRTYAGLLGAAAGLVATKLLEVLWRRLSGDEPPRADDPEVSARRAAIWAAASAAGAAVASVLANRFASRSWQRLVSGPVSRRSPRSSTSRP